jgi:hypothetical protein
MSRKNAKTQKIILVRFLQTIRFNVAIIFCVSARSYSIIAIHFQKELCKLPFYLAKLIILVIWKKYRKSWQY